MLTVLFAVGTELALGTRPVREALTGRLLPWIEERFNVAVELEDFSLSLFAGSLEVYDLSVAKRGAAPFARLEEVSVSWRPSSVVRRPLRLTSVTLVRPVVDLAQPLPEPPAGDSGTEPSELPISVGDLEVVDGAVSGEVPEAAQDLLRRWRVQDVGVSGSIDGSRFSLAKVSAAVRGDLVEAGALSLEVALAAEGRLGGDIEISDVRVTGEPLALEASGRLGADLAKSAFEFDAEADPGFWFGQPGARPVRMEGTADLGTWDGTIRLTAPVLAGTLIEEAAGLFVQDETTASSLLELLERFEVGSTSFAFDSKLQLVGKNEVEGALRLSASRDGTSLIEIEAAPRASWLAESTEATRVEVPLDIRVLPEYRGERSLSATLEADDLRQPNGWQIRQGRHDVDLPDANRFLAELARLWPDLVGTSDIEALPMLGQVAVSGSMSGPIADPWIDSRVEWRPHSNADASAVVAGRLVGDDLTITSDGRGLELARFVPKMSGSLEWSGRVTGGIGRPVGQVDLAVRDLEQDGVRLLEAIEARISGDRSQIEWTVDATSAEVGRIEGDGLLTPAIPLARAEGTIRVASPPVRAETPLIPFSGLETSYRLDGGAVIVDGRAFDGVREAMTLDARLPLDAVARLPGAEALADLPVERSDGLIEVSWGAEVADWAMFLPEAARQRVARLVAGSSGRLELDTECPACSRAHSTVDGLTAEIDGRVIAGREALELAVADGLLRLGSWSLIGEGFTLELDGFAELTREWALGSAPSDLLRDAQGSVVGGISSAWLEVLGLADAGLAVVHPGDASFAASGGWTGSEWRGEATLEAPELAIAPAGTPQLSLRAPRAAVRFENRELSIETLTSELGDGTLTATGALRFGDAGISGGAVLEIADAVPTIERLELPLALQDGVVRLERGRVVTAAGDGELELELPVGASARSTARLEWRLPAIDWAPLVSFLIAQEDPEGLVIATSGEAIIDLERPAETSATVEVGAAEIRVRGRSTRLDGQMSLGIAAAEVTLSPFTLVSGAERFQLAGSARLDRDWRAGQSPAELVSWFELDGGGTLDAGLMNPFLSGGRADGAMGINVLVSGTPADFSGDVRILGGAASILYRVPYLARISAPDVRLVMEKGKVLLPEGTAQLNNGSLKFSGTVLEAGRSDLAIRFDNSLFRLDYGLLATVDGSLRYRSENDGTALVSGDIVVERGSLTRSVQLDFDLLTELLAPIDLSTTADDPLALIALDLSVATREGVRVKNNLGDLLVRWEPIEVSGSLARPILKGEVEVDPGGLLYAYGQTVRLDRAVIEYPGGEVDEPRLDLEVTTSLEDPSIANLEGDDPFRSATKRAQDEAAPADLTGDLARFYGEQFASRIGESLGAKVSLRPVLIFGEANPGARLTVSRDFSTNFSVAASVDLTNAESQTYLLEAHDFRPAPGFVGQAYTNDEAAYGGAFLQRLEFGGSERASDVDLPRVRKIRIAKVPRVSKRGLKRALGLAKGEPFAAEDEFAAEVEVMDYLLGKGYPNAVADLAVTPGGRRGKKVVLELGVVPGPHVEFEFVGEKIPKSLRRLIRSYYRTDFFEPESIDAMREEAVRALRSQGFVEPEVQVTVVPRAAGETDGDRRVTIETVGGFRISPSTPIFETAKGQAFEAEDREALAAAFFGPVQRVELAQGLPGADTRLLRRLEDLGFGEARVVNRFMSLDEKRLTVVIDTGERRTAASVAVAVETGAAAGAPPGVEDLEPLVAIRAGEPLRRSRLALSAVRLEHHLADRGFLDARVRTVLGEAAPERPFDIPVRFEVEAGVEHRVDEVDFAGTRSTRRKWLERTAGLEDGEILVHGALAQARTSLWRTGLFSSVTTETDDRGDGRQRVVFDLAERDRYRLAYGIRWDSEDGTSAVFDVTDENFLGRRLTLGLRGLYSDDDKSLRWLTRVPRFAGGKGSLEFFALARELVEFGIVSEVIEGTLQYSRPAGRRATVRVYGRYRDTKLSEVDPNPFFPLDERIKSPLLGWQYLYDSRGAELFPVRGLFFSLDLSGSEEFLGSDFRYARLFSQLNLFRGIGSLAGRRVSWAQSVRVGFARAFDQELLRDERFFAGGEYSVRGYETETLGPEERLGSIVRPLGGESLLVVNQELRWRVLADYSLLLFGDVGNVWESGGDFGSDLFSSVGLGLRAATPVGLVRLDVALPLDAREGVDSDYVLYFGLGNTF